MRLDEIDMREKGEVEVLVAIHGSLVPNTKIKKQSLI